MGLWRHLRILIGAALVALASPAPPAEARGALSLIQDACLLMVGPDFMYFSGYGPEKPKKRYCEDVPNVGDAVFSMDFAQDEMREMKIGFRITRDIGETDEPSAIEAATLAYLPPKVYPAGSLSLRHNFGESGNYAGIVTADGPHGEHWVARFPFAVGRPYSANLPYYLLTAAVLLAIFTYFWGHEDPRVSKAQRKSSGRT